MPCNGGADFENRDERANNGGSTPHAEDWN